MRQKWADQVLWTATPSSKRHSTISTMVRLSPLTRGCFVVLLWQVSRAALFPTLQLKSGMVRGIAAGRGVDKFLGIPYAQPPIKELRWNPPRPPIPWNGTRDALKFSNSCMQHPGPWLILSKPSEDNHSLAAATLHSPDPAP